jgi:hypothetical protein
VPGSLSPWSSPVIINLAAGISLHCSSAGMHGNAPSLQYWNDLRPPCTEIEIKAQQRSQTANYHRFSFSFSSLRDTIAIVEIVANHGEGSGS